MMNLTCAILHADRQVSEQLEAFIAKTPFLALCGKYNNPIEALKGYYDNKVHLYFVGIGQEEMEGINGMEFSKLLSPSTRVIFIADTPPVCRRVLSAGRIGLSDIRSQFSGFFRSGE